MTRSGLASDTTDACESGPAGAGLPVVSQEATREAASRAAAVCDRAVRKKRLNDTRTPYDKAGRAQAITGRSWWGSARKIQPVGRRLGRRHAMDPEEGDHGPLDS